MLSGLNQYRKAAVPLLVLEVTTFLSINQATGVRNQLPLIIPKVLLRVILKLDRNLDTVKQTM